MEKLSATLPNHMFWLTAVCWAAAVICWAAAYYSGKFQAHFYPMLRSGLIPKGLSPRMALLWADYPPECAVLRRKAIKWGIAFTVLLLAGAVLQALR
jgi:hypothetical protein